MKQPHATIAEFFVPGKPAPQGSKRHVGRGILVESSREVGPWRERIALAAHAAMSQAGLGHPIDKRALAVDLGFVMPRPASTPKRSTPPAIRRPDSDKLARAVLDALTHIVFTDDSAVVDLRARKRLAERDEIPGVHISVRVISAGPGEKRETGDHS
ncbi:RusA family crossover junction endodeoxyribonuclease [Mycolicibacterium smegmatis]|nr:RusA family crossover junction endodeoxyribonuclease [Mycolicibacterium smegmatis]UGU31384.1 RusA family crossover junction endodeoxyribonuclease [Mycolicibacterium smegmatis]ULN73535.1 RusA family crossover junction endodeoxyribonuclease [Mycolicibacterium smegmatis]